MLRTMRCERLAGALRSVPDLIPFRRVMKRAKNHAADQFQIILGQGRPKDRRIFGHEADGAKLDPLVTRARAIGQNTGPGSPNPG